MVCKVLCFSGICHVGLKYLFSLCGCRTRCCVFVHSIVSVLSRMFYILYMLFFFFQKFVIAQNNNSSNNTCKETTVYTAILGIEAQTSVAEECLCCGSISVACMLMCTKGMQFLNVPKTTACKSAINYQRCIYLSSQFLVSKREQTMTCSRLKSW